MKSCYLFKGKLPTQYGIHKDIYVYVIKWCIIGRKTHKIKIKER